MHFNIIEKIQEIISAIMYKLPAVISLCVIILVFYVVYDVFISYKRTHQVPIRIQTFSGMKNETIDMRENFGTAFDDCVKRGYDTDFCLRSENLYTKRENIPI